MQENNGGGLDYGSPERQYGVENGHDAGNGSNGTGGWTEGGGNDGTGGAGAYGGGQQDGGQHGGGSGKEPFYRSTWFIVLLLFLFPPVGIPLAWVFRKPAGQTGRIILTVVSALILIVAITPHGGSSSSTGTSSGSSAPTGQSQTQTKQEATLDSITATYTGLTTAGTNISASNTGIKVTGNYSDGSTRNITGFSVDPAAQLVAEQTSTFTVSYEGKTCGLSIQCTTVSPETFKASCSAVDYESIARNPDAYKGSNITVTGKVIQVMESTSGNSYRINITQGDYGIWDDTVLVATDASYSGTRILEDDIVTVYGTSAGLYTYTSVLGASITCPLIRASYMDIN